jgi:hypothetical protein
MMKRYVEKFVNNLTLDDVKMYLAKENIFMTEEEVQFCFSYIKKNWHFIFDNQAKIFQDLKHNLNLTTYNQIEPILLSYQKKYQSFL